MEREVKRGDIYRTLENIVGPEDVTDKDFDLEAYSRDLSSLAPKKALYVVRPRMTDAVSNIVGVANRYRIPIYVRGGGTSHWGSWLPVQGGILLDMTEMNKIIEIDEENLIAHVQSGCTWYKLEQELRKRGLTKLPRALGGYAMTIGASVAQGGAGPIGTCKRGRVNTVDVLGLEVVLPTGETIFTNPVTYLGIKPIDGVGLGPCLTSLFIDSAGILGIFTEVFLRVSPVPKAEEYLFFTFNRYEDIEKVGDKLTRPVGDELAYSCSFAQEAGSLKKIRVSIWINAYNEEELKIRSNKVKEICAEAGGKEGDPKKAETTFGYLWKGLKDYFHPGPIENVAGWSPLYSLHRCWEVWRQIVVEKYGLADERFGFGGWVIPRGWGFYCHFKYLDPAEREKTLKVTHELGRKLLEQGAVLKRLGGSYEYLHMRDRVGGYYETIKKIKRMLDPNNILQPGILTP